MPKENLTGKFNATNVVFDEQHTPDAESTLNPAADNFIVDAPVIKPPTQQIDNLSVPRPIVPKEIVEDVEPYEFDGNRRPITGGEDQKPNQNIEHAKKLETIDLNQAKKEDGAKNVNRIQTGQDQNETLTQAQKDKNEREFTNLLERLQNHRLWIMGIMNDIQDDIDQLTRDIEECGRVIEALQDFKDGKIALGADGYPENDKAREAIKEWERKNNKKWDPSTQEGMDALDTIILSETNDRNEFIKQRSDKQTEWDQWNGELKATDETINHYSGAQYISSSETQDLRGWIEQAEKLREQEELRQQQEALENTKGVTADAGAENNTLTAATDIFNSAPGIS